VPLGCATDPNAPEVYRYDPDNPQVFRMDPARQNHYEPPPRVVYVPVPAPYRRNAWADIDAGWDRIQADLNHRELMRKLDEGNRQLERLNRQHQSYQPGSIGSPALPSYLVPGNHNYLVPGNPRYLPR